MFPKPRRSRIVESSPSVNVIDLLLIAVVSLFALRGYFKGLFREICALLGLFLGFVVAWRYDERAAALLAESWQTPFAMLKAVAFVALFFATYFSLNLVGWLLHRAAPHLFLQGINRIGGALVGAGKGTAFLALGIFFLISTPLLSAKSKDALGHSYLAPLFDRLARELVGFGKTKVLEPGEPRAGAGKVSRRSSTGA